MSSKAPGPDEFVAETQESLKRLGNSLVEQLESPSRESWSRLEFMATRVTLAEYGETHRMRLTVSLPDGDFPLIPRPDAAEACRELDRVSTLGGRPRWRALRLLMLRQNDDVSFQCWWDYEAGQQTQDDVGS